MCEDVYTTKFSDPKNKRIRYNNFGGSGPGPWMGKKLFPVYFKKVESFSCTGGFEF